jgi:hypothetical protein
LDEKNNNEIDKEKEHGVGKIEDRPSHVNEARYKRMINETIEQLRALFV